jgi:endo-1,4-beta-xylanase
VDNKFDIMPTELDISMKTNGGYPANPSDLRRQADVYGSLLDYALHFSSNCRAMLTWGFTDRYSWILPSRHYTTGDGLPLDWMYLPNQPIGKWKK